MAGGRGERKEGDGEGAGTTGPRNREQQLEGGCNHDKEHENQLVK
jgi:hypothetical protein